MQKQAQAQLYRMLTVGREMKVDGTVGKNYARSSLEEIWRFVQYAKPAASRPGHSHLTPLTCVTIMEVDSEEPPLLAVAPSNTENGKSYGLDSDDDETLRFDGEDDLYSSDLDDVDARWVTKQVMTGDCTIHLSNNSTAAPGNDCGIAQVQGHV